MNIRGVLVIAGVLAALLLVAGCGSDEDDATGSSAGGEVTVETGSLSKAEFIEQANEVCAKSREQLAEKVLEFVEESQENPTKPSEGSPEVEFVEDTYVPSFQQQLDKISAIGAPAGDEKQITVFLQTMQDGIDRAAEEPQAAADGDISLDEAAKLARAYGLKNCAEI